MLKQNKTAKKENILYSIIKFRDFYVLKISLLYEIKELSTGAIK